MPNMRGTGNQIGGGLSMDPSGGTGILPAEILQLLLGLMRSLPTQEMPPAPGPYQQQPLGPGELEQLMQMLTQPQQQPRQPMQTNPTMMRDLVNRGGNPWSQVEPGR